MSRDAVGRQLVNFISSYHQALEVELEKWGRQRFPFHGDATPIVVTAEAVDGFVTFYLPPDPAGQVPHGYRLDDVSQYDLNTVCQSLSVHRLKVASPRLGERWDSVELMPPDTEPIPGFSSPLFHEDVRQAAIAGRLASLPGMTISPVVHVELGIQRYVEPGRLVIWSPTFVFPGIGLRRLFLWTRADFWWSPERLPLDPRNAADVAANDVLALATVLRAAEVFTVDEAKKNAGAQAADALEADCDELLKLAAEKGHDEQVLHTWLAAERHHVFLDPHAIEVRSKLPFGAQVSDFVVRRSDGTYLLIEIEPASAAIFRHDNSEPTAQFNHGCQQVRDWQRYVRENVHTVRDEIGLSGIYEPAGMVVIGRSSAISQEDAARRWKDLKARNDPSVATYDDISDRVKALAASLRRLVM